jgi:hypothetical protein
VRDLDESGKECDKNVGAYDVSTTVTATIAEEEGDNNPGQMSDFLHRSGVGFAVDAVAAANVTASAVSVHDQNESDNDWGLQPHNVLTNAII